MSRNICITAADGQTGHLLTELLLTDEQFSSRIEKVHCLTFHAEKCEDLEKLGAEIVELKAHETKKLFKSMKESGADTIVIIPPAHEEKMKLSHEMVQAVKEAEIKNTILLSAAGADLAGEKSQPHLRDFIKIEQECMQLRYHPETEAGTSQCIIRAGFYTENLLLYNKDAQKSGKLRLPIGETHAFAPVALGDVVKVIAHILISEGPHGLEDKFRGQLITLTGPMMVNGAELAEVASDVGLNLEFIDISDTEAKQLLDSDTDVDDSEKQFLLEYYSLVREGKTNYVSTLVMAPITGEEPTQPSEFFKTYASEFKPKKRRIGKK
ncbi:hypothetical protein HYDPIDRAFT_24050 [Hydnomerulius pinastri MD-312]|nr:hypothetical protein HYDPIDRAFT_24050 [Hydnomerulius pinastri MD-312]